MQNNDCLLKIVGYAHLMWCEDNRVLNSPGFLHDLCNLRNTRWIILKDKICSNEEQLARDMYSTYSHGFYGYNKFSMRIRERLNYALFERWLSIWPVCKCPEFGKCCAVDIDKMGNEIHMKILYSGGDFINIVVDLDKKGNDIHMKILYERGDFINIVGNI